MKAPDKIYSEVYVCEDGFVAFGRTSSVPQSEDSVEYICKDTIMEWLERQILDADEGLMTNQIANLAYKDVIDKLNSL